MTATDELRKLLDERGVEYETYTETSTGFEHVKWGFGKYGHADFNVEFETPWLSADGDISSPEQAVEATLGRGKCQMDVNDNPNALLHGWSYCSECGPVYPPVNELILDAIKFCPFCGAEVER